MERVSCLTRNVCFTMQIWLGLLLLNVGIYRIYKIYEKFISHVYFLLRSLEVKIVLFVPFVNHFFLFHLSDFNKCTALAVQRNKF